ncbi:hypothetical protein AB6M97_06345 [Streptococcus hillyeri]|uniref:hypothetical protein n=1 Tax=Streptococcus hillyeri TaxID=2282420 RepID=UPI0034E2A719
MGLFNFLFGEKKKTTPSVTFKSSVNSDYDYYTERYYKLLEQRPNIFEIWGRDYNFPKYNDSYKTAEKYKLRELLLLVWWGKTKNGRKSSITIPKYFFLNYNLNAEKLTRQFKEEGWLVDKDDKTVLTVQGEKIYKKYIGLWEIHSYKRIPLCLDIDFPNWDKEKFDILVYKNDIKYHKENIKYCDKMIKYLNSLNAPSSAKSIYDDINYYLNDKNSSVASVNDLQEKLDIILERKQDFISN